jgi:hypothetical protein
MRATYLVQVGLGRRRQDTVTPEAGPCTPPYLAADLILRYVWVSVDAEQSDRLQEQEASLIAGEMAWLTSGADMITSTKILEAVL